MNYLITGGTGFLGSHLIKMLLCDNDNIITVVTTAIRDKNSMKILNIETDKINFKEGYESRRINITYLFGGRQIKKN